MIQQHAWICQSLANSLMRARHDNRQNIGTNNWGYCPWLALVLAVFHPCKGNILSAERVYSNELSLVRQELTVQCPEAQMYVLSTDLASRSDYLIRLIAFLMWSSGFALQDVLSQHIHVKMLAAVEVLANQKHPVVTKQWDKGHRSNAESWSSWQLCSAVGSDENLIPPGPWSTSAATLLVNGLSGHGMHDPLRQSP